MTGKTKLTANNTIHMAVKPGVAGDRAKGVVGTPPEMRVIETGVSFYASGDQCDELLASGAASIYKPSAAELKQAASDSDDDAQTKAEKDAKAAQTKAEKDAKAAQTKADKEAKAAQTKADKEAKAAQANAAGMPAMPGAK